MDEVIPVFQACDQCGQEKPYNTKHWKGIVPSQRGKYAGNPLFYPTCRQCLRKARAEKRIINREQREAEAEAAHLYWLAKLKGKQLAAVRQAVTGGRHSIAHIAEIFEALLSMFGGATGYAESMMSDYVSAAPGSIQRIQMHKVMQSYASKVTDSGAAKLPIESMDDEQLQVEVDKRAKMQLRLMVQNGQVHDVPLAEPPPEREAASG
jgi:hypothetical protein